MWTDEHAHDGRTLDRLGVDSPRSQRKYKTVISKHYTSRVIKMNVFGKIESIIT